MKGRADKMKENDLSHLEDELSRLSKRLEEEGNSDEITVGLDEILGKLADHLLKEEPQPNLMEKITGFFKRILGRG